MKLRVILASVTGDNLQGVCKVGEVIFDQRYGMGSVPLNANVIYKGAVALMHPEAFGWYAKPGTDDSVVQELRQEILNGKSIGSPFLILDDIDFESTGMLKVVGHEGRHRCLAIEDLVSEPIPVHLFIKSGNHRHFTPEVIESLHSIEAEGSSRIVSNEIQGLWLDGEFYQKSQLS